MRRGKSTYGVVLLFVFGPVTRSGGARAAASGSNAANLQTGDNSGSAHPKGSGGPRSGDANGGQIAGVVSSGRTSVDAKNTSRDSSVESGDVSGHNTLRSQVGLNAAINATGPGASATGSNTQVGDNRLTFTQTADATS